MVLTSIQLRTLSCAGLLATASKVSRSTSCLWLVDESGATAVRAMCLGGGYRSNDGKRTSAAEEVQKELSNLLKRQADPTLLYFDMRSEVGLATLMKIITEKELIRPNMRFELACLPSGDGNQQIKRMRIADILNEKKG